MQRYHRHYHQRSRISRIGLFFIGMILPSSPAFAKGNLQTMLPFESLFLFPIAVLFTYMLVIISHRSRLNQTLVWAQRQLQKELIDHKRAEEALIESRCMLQNILDLIPVRVFWKDRHSVFLGCNKKFAQDAGFHAPEDVVGRTDADMAWKHIAAQYREADHQVMKSGRAVMEAIEPRTGSDGRQTWLRMHKIPLKDPSGRILGVLGAYEDITESREAQEALRKSESKYHELVERMNSIVLRVNGDGEVIFINDFGLKFFGFERTEILGKNIQQTIGSSDVSHGGDWAGLWGNIVDQMSRGDSEKSRLTESENTKKDGERVWIAWANTSLVNENGEQELLSVGYDITARRKIEEEMARRTYAMEQCQNSVMITDTRGCIQYVNGKFCESTGYRLEEVLGKNPRILKSGELSDDVYKELWSTISLGQTWRGEFHNRKKNGEMFWERATITPVKDRKGNITSYLAVKEDVGQEKKLLQDLRKAFGRLKEMERIINLSNAIVFMWSPQERETPVKFVSDNIRLLGYEPEDFYLRGMQIRDFILDEDRSMVAETVKRNVRAKHLEFSHQYRVKTRDHQVRWFEDHSFVTYARNGEPKYIQGVAFDITDRRIAEEHILEAVNMKSEFISIVSHELRTPLTAIKESINIVIEEEAGGLGEMQKKFLGIAKRNVDRLGTLINDVLDYQKLDMGKLKFDRKHLDIRPLVQESVRTMTLVAKSKGLELGLTMPDGERPDVLVDADRIIQVLNNLINNAIKFTDKGGIYVDVVYLDKGIQILIKDTGIGIKAQDMHKLFHTFSQIRAGSERRSGETGLGLAISKKIIDSHGGAIWAESIYGQGSLFTFTLPFPEV